MESSAEGMRVNESNRTEFREKERNVRAKSTGEHLNQEETTETTGAIMKADDWKWAKSHFPSVET